MCAVMANVAPPISSCLLQTYWIADIFYPWGLIMRRFRCAALAAVALVGLASVAYAADLPTKAPVYKAPVAVAPSWTGFYIGANFGGGWGSRNVNYSPNDPGSVALFNAFHVVGDSFKSSGVLGGLQTGYNYQFNRNWLVGIETDFDWTGMKGSGSTPYATGLEFMSVDEHIKWFGTVRARLGYLPADNLLAYVTGGFAYGQVERSGVFATANGGSVTANIPPFSLSCASPASPTCLAGSSSGVAGGWTLGGGLEYAFWQNWTLKAEYLYVSLASKSVTEIAVTPLPGTTPSSFNANYGRTNFNVARVGVNYRF
jgi:outer membrane immunogenic protein